MSYVDGFGRKINYLRLSITDRCNMRCRYCMPGEGIEKLSHEDVPSYEELHRISAVAVSQGIEKIRVTGGEPLVRKDVVPFLARLAAIPGLRQLVLTTNGMMLDQLAVPLREAGVQRLNVSLDSLDPVRFAKITRIGDLSRVLAGIDAARRVGFPVKINMVVMRGINDHEVERIAALAIDAPFSVRFIEYMPAQGERRWQSLVVPGAEILMRLSARFPVVPVEREALSGPAREYRIRGARGTIGVITPVTGHFCGECNRIRVTSTGMAKGCLFSGDEIDLKEYLSTPDDAQLRAALYRLVQQKPGSHLISAESTPHAPFAMSAVGG